MAPTAPPIRASLPLRVVNDEKPDHIDLLLVIGGSGSHYLFYIIDVTAY
jgi:hypothetical protein